MYKFNIILTELCNANCSHCYMNLNSNKKKITMSVDDIDKIVSSKNKITLTKLDENNKQLYSWIIDGSSIKNRNPFLYKIIIPKELKKVFGQRLHRLGFSKEKFYPEIQNHHSR